MPVITFQKGDAPINQIPEVITAYQAQVALDDAGLLLQVEELINHPETPARIKLAWLNRLDLQRNNPMVLLIAEKLMLSVEQLDALFLAASKVRAGALE